MFAENYIKKHHTQELIEEPPENSVEMIVVIPCIKEPDIIKTLVSLSRCTPPDCKAEVIILLNHSETAPAETKEFNRQTRKEVDEWIINNPVDFMTFYAVGPVSLPKKWAGAGLARKKGMDEAMLRFNKLNKPGGIIVSLDADTLVHDSYFREIENHFRENPDHIGITMHFEHQTEGLDERHIRGIKLYEQYLKYYKEALEYTGYPYAMYTVGSAFAVTALAYVKRGGMNRRQAGEEFYFLQELAHQGTIGEIKKKLVFPSARVSERAPFGTGQMMKRWAEQTEDLAVTFDFQAFKILKYFFNNKDKLYKISEGDFYQYCEKLQEPLKTFLIADNFYHELENLNQNCSTLPAFRHRFLHLFNAFKIFRYLNFAHTDFFEKVNLGLQINILNSSNG